MISLMLIKGRLTAIFIAVAFALPRLDSSIFNRIEQAPHPLTEAMK